MLICDSRFEYQFALLKSCKLHYGDYIISVQDNVSLTHFPDFVLAF